MYTSYGDVDVAILRNRNGDYEPQLIKKVSGYSNTGHREKFFLCLQNE